MKGERDGGGTMNQAAMLKIRDRLQAIEDELPEHASQQERSRHQPVTRRARPPRVDEFAVGRLPAFLGAFGFGVAGGAKHPELTELAAAPLQKALRCASFASAVAFKQ
jgi:hypothetical protein